MANSLLSKGHVFGEGVNCAKAQEVGSSLLISPIVGFFGATLLLLLAKALIKRPELYQAPEPNKPPPPWIRGLLVLTCTGVSFFHGSNEGEPVANCSSARPITINARLIDTQDSPPAMGEIVTTLSTDLCPGIAQIAEDVAGHFARAPRGPLWRPGGTTGCAVPKLLDRRDDPSA